MALLGVQACSSDPGANGGSSNSSSNTNNNNNNTGSGGATSSGGTSTEDSSGDFGGTGDSSAAGGVTPGTECASETIKPTIVPVNLYLMVDRSLSMNSKNSKWPLAKDALNAFFQDPASAGLRVALRFFPDAGHSVTGCDGTGCNVDVCSKPQVDIAPLLPTAAPADTQEKALVDAVTKQVPSMSEVYDGYSPISAALAGAAKWTTAYHAEHPGEKAVIFLVTDGESSGVNCADKDFSMVKATAADAFAKGVPTYVVGMAGYFEEKVNSLAAAGGTEKAFFVGQTDVKGDLFEALETVKTVAVACDFDMPPSMPGKMIDYTKVDVNFTPKDGTTTKFPRVIGGVKSCTAEGGWYYDNDAKPTKLSLCPTSCTTAQADLAPQIDIVLGCVQINK